MPIVKLSKTEILYLENNHSQLTYNHNNNLVVGLLSFDLKYQFVSEAIKDEYQIEIDLNQVSELGIPIVRETAGRLLRIAESKKLTPWDLHLNSKNAEMCIIIPPKVKERYPKGFNLKILLEHIQEHLYWISYFERYDKKPWVEYGHGDLGYLELYLDDTERYRNDFKKYFNCKSRPEFRRKIKELRKKYKL